MNHTEKHAENAPHYDTSSVFVAVIGRPNVGKSSLTNLLVGEKVAIVTSKPQTTRTRITGVITRGPLQYVLLDTPGVHKAKNKLGKRMDNIRAARDLIAEIPLTCVSSCSRIYETEPAYETRQDSFANAVIEVRTELSPLVLLDELMKVENKLGRNRTASARENGPRTIDCDLIWMDGEVHGGNKLRLPHPKLGERDFVLVPLEDLMHDPARFFRYEGVKVLEPEERVGHVTGELGAL